MPLLFIIILTPPLMVSGSLGFTVLVSRSEADEKCRGRLELLGLDRPKCLMRGLTILENFISSPYLYNFEYESVHPD